MGQGELAAPEPVGGRKRAVMVPLFGLLLGLAYCVAAGGVSFSLTHSGLVRIGTPEKTSNFAFGDADYRSLYVTACTSLYRSRVLVPGKAQMQTR